MATDGSFFTLIIQNDKWTDSGKAKEREEKGSGRTHHGQLVARPGSGIWTQVADGVWAPEGPAGDRAGAGHGARGLQR